MLEGMELPRGILATIVPLVLVASSASAFSCERRVADRPNADGPVADRPIIRATTQAVPALRVTTEVFGLTLPWDVKQLPAGPLLITERATARRILVRDKHGLRALRLDYHNFWANGETGLMSLAIDPGFGRTNRRFYTCQGRTTGDGGHEIAVVAWRLGPERKAASYLRTVLRGIQITTGRHGGCRIMVFRNGAMYVGTGDSVVGTNPQDLASLNGKVLRLVAATGQPWPSNPYHDSANVKQRYIYTYGHRNVQGLALRSDGTLWSVEHGTNRDDEVNLLRFGANYGWNPLPDYNETAPMTDHSLPGTQLDARWSSGSPTIATSGAAWVRGSRWGAYKGTLAVAALAGERVVFMEFNAAGELVRTRTPAALRTFGRLRSVTRANNGDLLITTSNFGADRVLRVRPIA
jgi:glucose/arabinose dehydrogenase